MGARLQRKVGGSTGDAGQKGGSGSNAANLAITRPEASLSANEKAEISKVFAKVSAGLAKAARTPSAKKL